MRRSRGKQVRATGAAIAVLAVVLAACGTTIDGAGAAASTAGTSTSRTSSTGSSSSGSSTGSSTSSRTSSSTSSGPGTEQPDSHDEWLPSEDNPDPSVDIEDIYVGDPALYEQRYHFDAPDRVAYDRFPPVGGPHDSVWAACDGVVYEKPVRNEHLVHSLEHGAVWIAYNPDTVTDSDLTYLSELVPQVSYLVMTPYPGLDAPLSLQSWGHQLKLDSAEDPRFEQFVLALLRNPYLTPEVNATCSQPNFDVEDPPPFDGSPPGPDAIPLDYQPPLTTS